MEELDVLASDAMESLIILIILAALCVFMLFMFFPWETNPENCEYLCLSIPATTTARRDKNPPPSVAAKEETLISGVGPVRSMRRRASLMCKEDAPTVADAGGDVGKKGTSGRETGEMEDKGQGFKDGGDDGWELVERTQLVRDFERAVKFVDRQTAAGIVKLSDDEKSRFEGLINVAMEWLCKEPQTATSARANRNAGPGLDVMSPEDAMMQYLDLVQEKFPRWREDVEQDLQEQFFRMLSARFLEQ